ncbi:MAG: SRPBCC domain-containing protein [Pseudolabrys sp.]|nr:SRPBCC domain-containing protein [Pseudolabrys sp.]
MTGPTGAAPERALTVTRVLNAPREMVFKAWTDPKQLMQWWGPKHHPAVHIDMDVREGGRFRNCLRSPDTGVELWHHGVFREVVAPSLLVFTFAWEEEGERGIENLITIKLEDLGAKTKLTLHQTPFQSDAERDGHGEGWGSTFERLAEFVEAA